MKTLRLTVFAAVLAVLSGCPRGDKCAGVTCNSGQSCDPNTGMCVTGGTGGGGTGGGSNVTPIPVDQACAKLTEAQCDREVRCKRIDASEKASCVAGVGESCTVPQDAMHGAAYDGVATAECIQQIGTQDCADVDPTTNPSPPVDPARCADIVATNRGQASNPCQSSNNCQVDAGLYCQFNDFQRCQVCAARVGEGQFCAFDVDVRCALGLTCDENRTSRDGGHCRSPVTTAGGDCRIVTCAADAGLFCSRVTDGGIDTCHTLLGLGEGRCTLSSQCQGGLFCDSFPGDGGQPVCEALRANGQACSASFPCVPGTYCPPLQLDAGSPRVCTPLVADGTPCTTSSTCTSSLCAGLPTLGVDAGMSRCGAIAAGQACWRHTDCGVSSYCKGFRPQRTLDAGVSPIALGTCALLVQDGGACTNEVRLADSCANRAATCLDGHCVVTPFFSRKLGDTCDITNPGITPPMCGSGSRCDYADPFTFEGHCVAPLDDGQTCLEDPDCKAGSYCDYFGSGNCTPLGRVGQGCDNQNGPSCDEILTCNGAGGDGGTCGAYAMSGGMCDALNGPQCLASYCPADAGMCAARKANGQACSSSNDCSSSDCAQPDGGTGTTPDRICFPACY
jgi:hypothetical protein